jgi:hypothetical protein
LLNEEFHDVCSLLAFVIRVVQSSGTGEGVQGEQKYMEGVGGETGGRNLRKNQTCEVCAKMHERN